MNLISTDGVTLLKSSIFSQYKEIGHCFTTRLGGCSKGNFAELNLSNNVGDSKEAVKNNRIVLCKAIAANYDKLITIKQVLGRDVIIYSGTNGETADGIITDKADTPLLTQSADCLLILIYDPVKRVVGNIHASWRGTLGEIAKNAVAKMQEYYVSKIEDLRIAISPAIGTCCFEVGEDVANMFHTKIPYSEKFIDNKNGQIYINLWGINKYQFIQCGVLDNNIDTANLCTKCNSKLFYSYRRDGEKTGRFGAIIFIKSA